MGSHLGAILSFAALFIVAVLVFLVLFEPGLPYRVKPPREPVDTRRFVNFLSALVNARLFGLGEVKVLNNGGAVYEAELAAVRAARRSVHLEVYLFLRGRAATEMIGALEERARAGVKVRVVVDRYGSLLTPGRFFDALRAAGGEVFWYQPIAWYTLKRLNNRTHRDLLIVDGEVAFTGGMGIADYWLGPARRGRPWRDTMVRVTGDLVNGLQTSFAENWLEASGQILPEEAFPLASERDPESLPPASGVGMVVNSTPSEGRSTRARILFQVLMASARESILICSPYFIPDRRIVQELLRAARRGVRVTVLVPGRWNNHPIARLASRRRYGRLLEGGVALHEYQPSMIHAKVMIVDHAWSVLGSTNFDNRSLGLNDEVNVAILQRSLADRLASDFAVDLAKSIPITLEQWRRRPLVERALATAARVLERQA